VQYPERKIRTKCLFKNIQLLQGLDIASTHLKHGIRNYQSCIVAEIKKLHQEKYKRLTIRTSANQVESNWFLLIFM